MLNGNVDASTTLKPNTGVNARESKNHRAAPDNHCALWFSLALLEPNPKPCTPFLERVRRRGRNASFLTLHDRGFGELADTSRPTPNSSRFELPHKPPGVCRQLPQGCLITQVGGKPRLT